MSALKVQDREDHNGEWRDVEVPPHRLGDVKQVVAFADGYALENLDRDVRVLNGNQLEWITRGLPKPPPIQ